MTLFDTLLAARDALEEWLIANPRDDNASTEVKARRTKMADAEDQLSRALETIEDQALEDSVNGLQAGAQSLRDAATAIENVEASVEKVDDIVKDVGIVVGILQKIVPGV